MLKYIYLFLFTSRIHIVSEFVTHVPMRNRFTDIFIFSPIIYRVWETLSSKAVWVCAALSCLLSVAVFSVCSTVRLGVRQRSTFGSPWSIGTLVNFRVRERMRTMPVALGVGAADGAAASSALTRSHSPLPSLPPAVTAARFTSYFVLPAPAAVRVSKYVSVFL